VHDGIHTLQYFGPKPAHVRKILNVGPALWKDFRIRQAVSKVSLVEADQGRLRIGLPKAPKDRRADVPGVARDQYLQFSNPADQG